MTTNDMESISWILAVDDNPDDLNLVVRAFKKLDRPEEIVCRLNAAEAILELEARPNQPDLVLLDSQMPGMRGEELLRMLRSEGRTQFMPVVVYSGQPDPRAVAHALNCGANSYVKKRVGYDEVLEDLRRIFEYWLEVNEKPTARTRNHGTS